MKHYENLSLNNIEGEVWFPVVGFENEYHVSTYGRVKRISSITHPVHILKQTLNRGYCNVCLCVGNVKYTKRVHRIMGYSILKTVENKPYINHKDGIRDNNVIENLEWCNNSENQKHSYEKLGRVHHKPHLGKTGPLCKNSRPVNQLDMNGNLIKKWAGQSEAARALGLYQSNIYHACHGNYKSCGGYKWSYA